MIVDLLFIILGVVFLYVGAEMLVSGSVALSYKLRIAPILVGLIVIGLGTSSPELVVSIRAAIAGSGEVAVGNVVGSNIANIALVLGLGALIRPIPVDKNLLASEVPALLIVTALITLLVSDGILARMNGVMLILGLCVYLWITFRSHRRIPAINNLRTEKSTFLLATSILGGLALLIAGAELMVSGALGLAHTFHLSEAVIGLTIVALGTSIPELATVIIGAVRKQGGLIIGGLIGSNILNILFVLGITASVHPMELIDIRLTDLLVMCFLAVLVWPLFRSGYRVSRVEGLVLLFIYAGYLVHLFVR